MANRDGDPDDIDVWQDREIRFDIHTEDLACRRGEYVIDNMEHVEDTKGNNGDRGVLSITNLRMVWRSAKRARTNLSIGYAAIISINIRAAQSRLRGNTHALYVLTKFSNSRFEFVFTNLVRNSPRLFTTIQAVFRAYSISASACSALRRDCSAAVCSRSAACSLDSAVRAASCAELTLSSASERRSSISSHSSSTTHSCRLADPFMPTHLRIRVHHPPWQ